MWLAAASFSIPFWAIAIATGAEPTGLTVLASPTGDVITLTVLTDGGASWFVGEIRDPVTTETQLFVRRWDVDTELSTQRLISDGLTVAGELYLPATFAAPGTNQIHVLARTDGPGPPECEEMTTILEEMQVGRQTLDVLFRREVDASDGCTEHAHSFLTGHGPVDSLPAELGAVWTVRDLEDLDDLGVAERKIGSPAWSRRPAAAAFGPKAQDHAVMAYRSSGAGVVIFHDGDRLDTALVGAFETSAGLVRMDFSGVVGMGNWPHVVNQPSADSDPENPDDEDVLHLVWEQADTIWYSACTGSNQVCSHASAWSAPQLVTADLVARRPQVAWTQQGHVFVAWDGEAGLDGRVRLAARCAADSNFVDAERQIDVDGAAGDEGLGGTAYVKSYPALAVDSSVVPASLGVAYTRLSDGDGALYEGRWGRVAVDGADGLCPDLVR